MQTIIGEGERGWGMMGGRRASWKCMMRRWQSWLKSRTWKKRQSCVRKRREGNIGRKTSSWKSVLKGQGWYWPGWDHELGAQDRRTETVLRSSGSVPAPYQGGGARLAYWWWWWWERGQDKESKKRPTHHYDDPPSRPGGATHLSVRHRLLWKPNETLETDKCLFKYYYESSCDRINYYEQKKQCVPWFYRSSRLKSQNLRWDFYVFSFMWPSMNFLAEYLSIIFFETIFRGSAPKHQGNHFRIQTTLLWYQFQFLEV